MALDDCKTSRRAFSALALGTALSGGALRLALAGDPSSASSARSWQRRLATAPKLFCLAYITPDAPGQGGQEPTVARYPLAVMGQERRAAALRFRGRIRELNPEIVTLGYQMTIEENTVPGPGHDLLRQLAGCWVQDGSDAFTVTVSPGKKRRVYDTRRREWQDKFVQACLTTLEADPYDGLFLDQCTVYSAASPDRAVRDDMKAGIQAALTELRRQAPDALIVANSSFSFDGVNGELNENRPRDYAAELAPYNGHAHPSAELAYFMIKSDGDRRDLKERMQAVQRYGAYFGAGRDYQHVEWYEEFDSPPPVPNPPSKPAIENS